MYQFEVAGGRHAGEESRGYDKNKRSKESGEKQ